MPRRVLQSAPPSAAQRKKPEQRPSQHVKLSGLIIVLAMSQVRVTKMKDAMPRDASESAEQRAWTMPQKHRDMLCAIV